jgi:hypothetical protein
MKLFLTILRKSVFIDSHFPGSQYPPPSTLPLTFPTAPSKGKNTLEFCSAGKIHIFHILLQSDKFQVSLYSNLLITQTMSRDIMHIIHSPAEFLSTHMYHEFVIWIYEEN